MNHENTKSKKHEMFKINFRVFILSCFRDEKYCVFIFSCFMKLPVAAINYVRSANDNRQPGANSTLPQVRICAIREIRVR